jgi:hypothetical protein
MVICLPLSCTSMEAPCLLIDVYIQDIPPFSQSGVNIPTYLIQGQDGMNMYNTLKTYQHSNVSIGSNVTKSRALRVTMYPASGAFPSAWEFTLIIVVALLAVSFILSGILRNKISNPLHSHCNSTCFHSQWFCIGIFGESAEDNVSCSKITLLWDQQIRLPSLKIKQSSIHLS